MGSLKVLVQSPRPVESAGRLAKFPRLNSAELDGSWKGARRMWGHSLHRLAPYNGTFPPALAHYFIQAYSDPGQTVLDPFSGSGTTPLEACLCARIGVGNDPFPYAKVLTHAKVRPLGATEAREAISWLRSSIGNSHGELDNDDIAPFFHPETLSQILSVREFLRGQDSDAALFLKALMCGVIHGPSKMFLSLSMKDTAASSTRYIQKYAREHGLVYPLRDVFESLENKLRRTLVNPPPVVKGAALGYDARDIGIEDESVNLIVTSPPYLHVLDYSWNHWVRLWFLGENRLEARSRMFLSGNEPKFMAFMEQALREMYRVLAPESACVVVVGDVRSKSGTGIINLAEKLAPIATKAGFRVRSVIADPYPLGARSFVVYNESRYKFDSDDNPEACAVPLDRCLVLEKGRAHERTFRSPWEVRSRLPLEAFGRPAGRPPA
jgi:DNA methylase